MTSEHEDRIFYGADEGHCSSDFKLDSISIARSAHLHN
jgi:hypothetical protein